MGLEAMGARLPEVERELRGCECGGRDGGDSSASGIFGNRKFLDATMFSEGGEHFGRMQWGIIHEVEEDVVVLGV